jgi:hypothetical protein
VNTSIFFTPIYPALFCLLYAVVTHLHIDVCMGVSINTQMCMYFLLNNLKVSCRHGAPLFRNIPKNEEFLLRTQRAFIKTRKCSIITVVLFISYLLFKSLQLSQECSLWLFHLWSGTQPNIAGCIQLSEWVTFQRKKAFKW